MPNVDIRPIVKGIKDNLIIAMNPELDKNGDKLFKCSDETGLIAKERKISVSQLRKIYAEARKINYNNGGVYKLKLMKAMLAYTAGRFTNMKELKEIFDIVLDEAQKDEKHFQRFMDFFQAVIAYHRAHGGKE